jgi:hypothetical protein
MGPPTWSSTSVVVGVGAFDAHLGALGAEIEPWYLSKVMGTSTCDMLVAPLEEVGDKLVKGHLRSGGWIYCPRHDGPRSRTIGFR